jgi:hypothetical protein
VKGKANRENTTWHFPIFGGSGSGGQLTFPQPMTLTRSDKRSL